MKSTYYFDKFLGHTVECNGDTLFHFELCNNPPMNNRRIWGYSESVWVMERIQRRMEDNCSKNEPFYVRSI